MSLKNPINTSAWNSLSKHFNEIKTGGIKLLFEADPTRFHHFSIEFENLLIDYSKNRITDKTIKLLVELATECRLKEAILSMFSGEKINHTEKRAVLHTALRNKSNHPVL